ncbi:MAG: 3-isopropylmalate dehydratase small subunit [Candidatus Brockarchaeota archaeon]|nr:3-isopropylmalate dehydratase small subunit [Candidatus Brockarchaeota archaeon]
MIIRGKVVKLGDNIDTDVIIPARYLVTHDATVLAEHVFEDYYPEFREKAKEGVIIVAGENFGLGSSREHAVIALKHSNVKAVVAKSFARIFYRNAINLAMPALVLEEKNRIGEINDGDEIEINLEKGILRDLNTGKEFSLYKIPDFIVKILKAGGLISYFKEKGQK